jgi:hypothetical protein
MADSSDFGTFGRFVETPGRGDVRRDESGIRVHPSTARAGARARTRFG